MDRLGVRLDPERPVRGLSIADQQIVEIAKALSFDARVLIMDEPTAALSGPEVERLFSVVRTLREHGAAVLFISHRLEEVFTICDTVTVMRDGAVVHDARMADMTPDEMVRRMVGPGAQHAVPQAGRGRRRRSSCASTASRARACSSTSGSRCARGRSWRSPASSAPAAARWRGPSSASTGRTRGRVEVAGRRLPPGRPGAAMRAGVGFVPEDRRQQGLVMDLSIARNTALTRLRALSRLGLIAGGSENRLAREWASRLQLKFHRLTRSRRHAVGRQPAEGRARQVARDGAEAADHRRAHARHRRRHEGGGPPPDERARRAGASPC